MPATGNRQSATEDADAGRPSITHRWMSGCPLPGCGLPVAGRLHCIVLRSVKRPGPLALLLILAAAIGMGGAWWWTREPVDVGPWVGAVKVLPIDGRFSEPFGIAVAADGSIFVSDAGTSDRIHRIDARGRMTTLAGSTRGFADGRGGEARFATPSGIAIAPDGSLVVADTGNHAIRRIAPDGTVTTLAGNGVPGYVDGAAADARFRGPLGIAVDADGRIIVADTYNDRIRAIDPDGSVRTIAGGDDAEGVPATGPRSAGYVDGPASIARFDTPTGVAVDAQGRILVADMANGAVRIVAPDGTVSTLATPDITLVRPISVTIPSNGLGPVRSVEDSRTVGEGGLSHDVYIADEAGRVIIVDGAGTARTIAGGQPGFADGVGDQARFRRSSSIAVRHDETSASTHLLVADAGNALVRTVMRVHPDAPPVRHWPWTTIDIPTPESPRAAPTFDTAAFARTPLLWPVAPMDGPHEVAGTFGEARGEAGQERFHAGLDVREEQGTPVRAIRDGVVGSPLSAFAYGTLNEGVRVGDIAYVHIRVGRMRRDANLDRLRFAPVYDASGALVRMRAMRGARFTTGDVVGSVNAFNHVHVNVGWPGEEHDPLRFRLLQFRDTIAPTIAASGVRFFDEGWQPLNPDRPGPVVGRGRARRLTRRPPLEPVLVRGRVRVVVDAWDQADGNKAHRRLGLSRLGYQVIDATGTPVAGAAPPRSTILFDRMPRFPDAPRLVYANGSGIPVYGAARTQFLYVVTTTYDNGVAAQGFWDTTTLPPGPYTVRVWAQDFSGNTTTRDVRTVVVP